MSRPLVVDASVAFKWFVPEVGRSQALDLLNTRRRLIAPDLLIAEVANIAWKARSRGAITADVAADAIERVHQPFDELVDMRGLASAAHELGFTLRHPVYDFFYVALAIDRETQVVTADERLWKLTRGTSLADRVTRLQLG